MRTKNNVKVIAITLAFVMLLMGLLVVLIKVSDGFQSDFGDWKLRKVNEDNLWQTMSFAADDEGLLAAGEHGVTVKLTEDNVLKINGTAEQDIDVLVGTVTLKANTSYVFDSDFSGSGKSMYIELEDSANGTTLVNIFNASKVYKPTSDTVVKVVVHIINETDVSATLKPVLCVGTSSDDLVDFYK